MFGFGKDPDNLKDDEIKIPSEWAPPEESSAIRRSVGDTALGLLKGGFGIGEALVGNADLIPTPEGKFGAAGKAVEKIGSMVGFEKPFEQIRTDINSYLSPETIRSMDEVSAEAALREREFTQATGFQDKALAAITGIPKVIGKGIMNPAGAWQVILESLPSMAGGVRMATNVFKKSVGKEALEGLEKGFLAKGMATKEAKEAAEDAIGRRAVAIGAAGETGVTLGQNLESVRQQTEGGYLDARQTAIQTVSAMLTGGISGLSGRLAQRMGHADADTFLTGIINGELGRKHVNIFKKLLYSALREGALEEMPQSLQEQISQNLALGKPIEEGTFEATALGFLSGVGQSSMVNISSDVLSAMRYQSDPTKQKIDKGMDELKAGSQEVSEAMGGDTGSKLGGIADILKKVTETTAPSVVLERPGARAEDVPDFQEEQLVQHKTKSGNDYLIDIGNNRVYADVKGQKGEEVFKHKKKAILDGYANREALQAEEKRKNTEKLQKNRDREIKIEAEKAAKAQKVQAKQDEFNSHIETLKTLGGYSDKDIAGYDLPKARKEVEKIKVTPFQKGKLKEIGLSDDDINRIPTRKMADEALEAHKNKVAKEKALAKAQADAEKKAKRISNKFEKEAKKPISVDISSSLYTYLAKTGVKLGDYSDKVKNKMGQSVDLSRQLSEDANNLARENGKPLDRIADELSDHFKRTITEDDVYQWIVSGKTKEIPMESGVTKAAQKNLTEAIKVAETTQRDLENQARNDLGKYGVKPEQSSRVRKIAENFNGDPDTERGKADLYQIYQAEGLLEPAQKMGFVSKSQTPSKAPLLQGTSAIQWVKQKQAEAETERASLIKSGGGAVNTKDLEKIKNKITVLKAAIIGEGENAKLSPAVTDLYGDEARSKVELSGKIPEKINPEVAADVASGFKKLVPVREAEKEKTASVDELFENNKDLVGKILNSKSAAGVMSQINRGKLEREVANQVGAMALVEAAQKWDRVRDFRKYASGIILGKLMNETRGSSLQDRFIHSYITEISNDLESKNKRKPTNEEILVGLNIKLAEKQKDAEKRGKNKDLQRMKPLTMDHLEKYLASTADHESFEEEGDEDKVPTKIGGVAQKSPQKKLEEKDSGNFTRQNIINAMTYLNDLELDIALNEFFTEDRYKKTDEQLASRHNVNRLVVQRLRPKTKDGRIIEKGKVLDKIEARLGQPANEYAKGTIVAKIKIKVAKTWEGNILGLPLPQQDAEAIGESTGEGYTYKTKDKILRDVTSIKDKTLTDEDIRVLETAINGRVMGEEYELANTIPFLSTVPWVQGKKNSKDPAEKRLFDDSLRRLKATIETDIEMADVPGQKYKNIEWKGEKYPQFIRTADGILIFENGEYTDHPTRESLEEAGIDPKYITSGYWRAATDSERETALNKISDVSENAEEFLVKELPRYRFEGDHRTMFIGTMSEAQIARLAKMNIQNLSKEQYAKIIRRLDKLNEERTKAAVGENRKGWNYSIPEIRARQRRSVEIQRLRFNFDHTILPSLSAAIQGGKEGIRWDESGYQNKSFRRAYERARQDGYELIPIRSGYVNAFIDPKSKQIFCEIGQTIDALNLVGHELSHAGSEGHASNEETQKQINQRSPAVIAYAEKLSAIHNNGKPIEEQKPLPMWYVLKEYAADLQGGILENYGIKLHDGLNMNAQIDYIVNPFTQVAQEEKESERTLSSHGLALNLIETHDKKSMTAVDAIVEIEKTTETEFPFNELADYMQRFGIRISYDSSQMGNSNLDAEYSPEENTIFIGKLSNYTQDLLMAAADKRLYSAIAHQGVLGIIEQSMIAKGRYLQDTMNLKRAMKDFVGDIEASLNEAPENVQKKYRAMMENSKNNLSVIAHGMTNKDFAQWLNSLPDYSANAIRPESFWTRLKKIILKYIGRVTKEKTKLDRLNEILDEHAGIGFTIPSAVRTEAEVETRIRELEDYFLEDARKYPDEVAYIVDKTTILKEQYPATTDKQKEKYVDYLKIIWAASQNRELIASEDQHNQIKARYGGDIEERRRQWLAFSNELLENEKQRLARKALQSRTTAAPVSPFLYGMKIVPETKVVPSGEYSLEPTPKVKTTEEVLGINDQAAMDILLGFAGARGATVAQRGSTISVTGINIPAEGMIRQADKPLGESKETGKLSIMDDKGRQIGSLEITPMADGYKVSNLSLNKPKMVPDVVKYLFTANKNIDKLERDFSDAEIKANSKSVKAEAAMWEKLYSSKFAAGPVALTRDRFNQYLLDQKEAAIEKIENASKLTAEQRAAKYALAKEEEESRKAREAEIERRKGLPPEEQARLAAEDRLISARYTEAAKIIAKTDDRWESALQAALEFLDPVEFDEVSRLIKKPKKKMTKAAGKYLRIAKLLEWLAETEDRNRVTSLSAKEFEERSAKEVKFSAKDVDRMEYVGIAKNTNDKIIDALNNLVNPKKKEKLPPGIAKRRVTGKDDPKTGEKKLYHPAITIQEFKLLKAIKDLRSGRIYDRPLTGWLENPIRTFEELGTDIKELFYRPMKVGENNAKKEFSAMVTELQEMLKPYSWWQRSKVSRRIGIYAIAKQEGGSEVLKAMNITNIPQLTAHEMKIYEWMRGKFEKQYELLQEARALAGKKGFGKVEDYFTFARQFGVMEKLGFSPIFSKEFIHLKTTHFGFEKGRVGGLHKADLDAFGVFGRYMESATRHVALSPAIAKGREMVGLFDDGVDSEGEPITWMLADKAPTAARFITEWLDFQAGQRKIQLPPLIETGLRALNRNLAYATLAANVRSALIQPAALSNTVTAIGPKWAIVGIRSLMDKTAIDKSNVLRARQFDINVAEMMGGWFGRVAQVRESAGNWGIKGLQNLDMLTARATWHGAYQKGLSEGMKEIDAINYADDIVTKTQGSAMPSDLSPAQRTALGKAITMFQTFTINQWGFLTKDVLGINNKNVSRRDAGIKIFTFIGMALLLNWIYEDIFGLPTPLPSPIKAFIKALEAGEDMPSASVEAALEVASLLPIIGGGLRYGQSPFGAPYEYMADLFKKASSGPYKGPEKPWLELIAKGAGVPGTAQSSKMYRVHKKGGSVTDIILGRYETERDPSKIKENLTEALRKKKPGTNAEIQKQYRAGKLTSRDVQGIQRDARIDPRLVKFKALSLEKAIQEYSDASKEERRLYMSAFIKKREAINNYAPGTEQRKELQKKYRKALNG
jgi:hypothetical protein